MSVPEATMDEDDRLTSWKNKVWSARQATAPQPISQPTPIKSFTYKHLKRCVSLLDTLHAIGSLGLTERIHHWTFPSQKSLWSLPDGPC